MAGKLLSKDQLVERINLFPEAAEEYRLYKKSKRAVWISQIIGVPLLIAGNIYAHQQNVSNGLLIGGSVILLYTIQIPGFFTIKHHKRFLNIYNKRICER
jgi:hypothetical protein